MSEEQKFEVIISDAALAMLDSHVEFLARVSEKAATNLMEEILSDIESLSEHPQRFPVFENQFIADNRYHKMLSARRYLVIYEVNNANVFVDHIVDCRQNFEWLIV